MSSCFVLSENFNVDYPISNATYASEVVRLVSYHANRYDYKFAAIFLCDYLMYVCREVLVS